MPHGVDGFLTLLAIYLGACLFSGLASIRLRAIQSRRYFHIVLAESIDFFPSAPAREFGGRGGAAVTTHDATWRTRAVAATQRVAVAPWPRRNGSLWRRGRDATGR